MNGENVADGAALDAVLAVRPVWRANRLAADAAGLEENVLLHAGPGFPEPAAITAPILNSACVAAVYEGLADDFPAAADAISHGDIVLRPAQDYNVTTPLAAVISASMYLHEVVDDADPTRACYAPINGGNGPAMRLGLRNDDVLTHIRWLNGPFAEALGTAQAEDLDLIAIAAESLAQGDDGHGRTVAGTTELTRILGPRLAADGDAITFLDDSPSFFLNLWMAACKCALSAATGHAGSSVVTAAGGNGRDFGIQVAGAPGRWFTAPADPPIGDLGKYHPDRALGAIGDSAIVDTAGFGAMAISYAPAQQATLGGFMPEDGNGLPERLLSRVHPGYGDLLFRTGLCARTVMAAMTSPTISLGIIDRLGEVGRLGGGIYQPPVALFAEALAALDVQ